MDALDCIFGRRSVRKYTQQPVEWEKVGRIIEAGINAPSSGNIQNWRFIVVTDNESRKKLADASLQQYWMASAPVHIVILSDVEKVIQFYGIRGERLYAIQNCAACIQNMMLAAYAEGLGSCWIGAFEEEMVVRTLSIPDTNRPQAIMTIGYPDEKPKQPPRQPLYDKVFVGSFGSRISDIQHVMGYHSAKVQKIVKKGEEILQGKHDEKIKRGYHKGKEFLQKVFKK